MLCKFRLYKIKYAFGIENAIEYNHILGIKRYLRLLFKSLKCNKIILVLDGKTPEIKSKEVSNRNHKGLKAKDFHFIIIDLVATLNKMMLFNVEILQSEYESDW